MENITIAIPRVPFDFFGPEGQMEVYVGATEGARPIFDPENPTNPRFASFQAYITSKRVFPPVKNIPIGRVHIWEKDANKALLSGVEIQLDQYPDPNSRERRALDALINARETKEIKRGQAKDAGQAKNGRS